MTGPSKLENYPHAWGAPMRFCVECGAYTKRDENCRFCDADPPKREEDDEE